MLRLPCSGVVMSQADVLVERYVVELRGFGASLPDDFAAAARALEGRFSDGELVRWAETGIALANHSLRSWEAAAEYFPSIPPLASQLRLDARREWVAVATGLASRAWLRPAAFLNATARGPYPGSARSSTPICSCCRSTIRLCCWLRGSANARAR